MRKHDVIYVPGIGDTKTTFQELAAKTWRLYGVMPYTFPMRWASKEPFGPKFERLLAFIDAQLAAGHIVSLVGASAGATVAINAYAARPAKINGMVLLSGKVNRPEAIGSWYQKNAPAFLESASMAASHLAGLDASRVLSLYGVFDPVVPKADSYIPGARNRALPSAGHAVSIAVGLLLAPVFWTRFLRRLSGNF